MDALEAFFVLYELSLCVQLYSKVPSVKYVDKNTL